MHRRVKVPAQSVSAYSLAEACRVSTVCACATAVPMVKAKSAPQLIKRFDIQFPPFVVDLNTFVAAILTM